MDSINSDCKNLIIDVNQPLLIIDLSYFIFYRYYATLKWCEYISDAKVEADKLLSNNDFIQKYEKLFRSVLMDLMEEHNILGENLILVRDCSRNEIWRLKHMSRYKANRDENNVRLNKNIFGYTLHTLLPKLQKEINFQITNHKSLEADDCIAIIKNQVREQNLDVKIIIISNDNDFVQLIDENTYLKNLKNILLNTRIKTPQELYLETKIIMGDKSDNIPAIANKIGPKTSEKFAKNSDQLEAFFQKNPSSKEQYVLNRLLIDFRYIPNDLRTSYISTINYIKA